jgi:N-acylneuraminate cytidylyltransferase
MSNLCIIPARGGSKRIPKKNMKDFLGKPIIAYSIEAAINSGLFDEVMVSTDDAEIAEIAIKFGAKVPFLRSEATANDFASTWSVVDEVIRQYKTEIKRSFDYVCCIYPTAPLIQANDLKTGLELLQTQKFSSIFPVVKFSYPVWRGLERNDTGTTKMVWPENLNARSQDLKEVYHDAGQWYWINPNMIIDTLFTDNSGSIILEERKVQDIDNPEDWKIAEIKYKLLNET